MIPLFVTRVLAGRAPVIFGDGEQSRDFVFVRDAVRANILAAEDSAFGVFNIGSARKTTVNSFARIIIKLAGNNGIKLIYQSARAGDVV